MNIQIETQTKQNKDNKNKKRIGLKKAQESRPRAKTSILNQFEKDNKAPIMKKETKPVETIGNDRFKNLLNVFSGNNNQFNKENTNLNVGKLEFNRFSNLSNGNTENSNQIRHKNQAPVLGISIKDRMNTYFSNNVKQQKERSNHFDSVLNTNIKYADSEEEQDEEEDTNELDLSNEEENNDISLDSDKENLESEEIIKKEEIIV